MILFDDAFARHDLPTWRRKLDAAGITFGVIVALLALFLTVRGLRVLHRRP